MDLYICAVKYMESWFKLCKHVANQENGANRYYKVVKSGYFYVY